MAGPALLLFAHGARDARWAEPFQAVASRIRARHPGLPVVLAFLEHLTPDLATGLRELRSHGATQVRIVPLFFGRGGHLREDFPRILAAASAAVPDLAIDVTVAAGESEVVQAALAVFALDGLGSFVGSD